MENNAQIKGWHLFGLGGSRKWGGTTGVCMYWDFSVLSWFKTHVHPPHMKHIIHFMKHIVIMLAAIALLPGCSQRKESNNMSSLKEKTIIAVIDSLVDRLDAKGSTNEMADQVDSTSSMVLTVDPVLIEKGVRNAARFWKTEDGTDAEFMAFCLDKFIIDRAAKERFYQQFSRNL
jgi:hypothetical protein